MATTIAVISLLAILVCVPLAFLRPVWVFYVFLASTVFGNVLGGYVFAAGNLGLPRTWQPADALAWLILGATLLLPRREGPRSGLHGCLQVITVMAAISLLLGLILHTTTALTVSRSLHFVAAMLFALRYFTEPARVERFLKFATLLLLFMFVLHVLLRFGLFRPPISEEQATGQMSGERGNQALLMEGYLLLLSIGVARLAHGRPRPSIAIFLIIVSSAGIMLSETRALYIATLVLGLLVFLFVQGRIKTLLICGVGGVLALTAAAYIGLDVTARFRAKFGRGEIVNPLADQSGWRTLEYRLLLEAYVREPLFILTGRGIGAQHYVPIWGERAAGNTGYWHGEYLSWLDRMGLVGFSAYAIMLFGVLVQSRHLAKSGVQPLAYFATVGFLLVGALVIDSFFWPTFMNPRGAPLFISIVVIVANWPTIWLRMTGGGALAYDASAEDARPAGAPAYFPVAGVVPPRRP